MSERTVETAGVMAKVGVAMLALPLVDLPAVASAHIHSNNSQVSLQLAAVQDGGQVAGLLAWADVLPERIATGLEWEDYIRLAVVGVIDGVRVEVWTHLRGEQLVDARRVLALPLDGAEHALSLGALRSLAQHGSAVSTDA
ncbi:hypothetical protein I4I73_21535 [Pseudonocardia sp. KRD-184]|uniref:Uncharacterized protein n=1 Tax=Pseudonocardia oceani TaxID=2792013 RepID=A0ABS6U9Y4_9PSEU|nr:hypothetical protein [Pseudonocardia oceani]MBW0091430.1 hypothetical protein [Pseudonocardia oceani]MBW0098574.1 hypothetical protein [Pseudonocardia oceani]MBW0111069.1 hypothetical protein [Pseudonocardia oceani]MBW0125029.1 hypothetical protein [Pseudonocardia oceani]MBW0129050.1 hypothetical protein [Pseudonocardia oceani]